MKFKKGDKVKFIKGGKLKNETEVWSNGEHDKEMDKKIKEKLNLTDKDIKEARELAKLLIKIDKFIDGKDKNKQLKFRGQIIEHSIISLNRIESVGLLTLLRDDIISGKFMEKEMQSAAQFNEITENKKQDYVG